MKLQKAFITALACTAIIFAAGTNQGGSEQGGTGQGGAGQGKGTAHKAMMITGTIETVDTVDSLITLKPDTGTTVDTVYFTSKTKVGKQAMKSTSLKIGERVRAHYREMNGKKVAFEIMPMGKTKGKQGGAGAGQGGQGQGGQSGQGQGGEGQGGSGY